MKLSRRRDQELRQRKEVEEIAAEAERRNRPIQIASFER
jgi:hypothetical protein